MELNQVLQFLSQISEEIHFNLSVSFSH